MLPTTNHRTNADLNMVPLRCLCAPLFSGHHMCTRLLRRTNLSPKPLSRCHRQSLKSTVCPMVALTLWTHRSSPRHSTFHAPNRCTFMSTTKLPRCFSTIVHANHSSVMLIAAKSGSTMSGTARCFARLKSTQRTTVPTFSPKSLKMQRTFADGVINLWSAGHSVALSSNVHFSVPRDFSFFSHRASTSHSGGQLKSTFHFQCATVLQWRFPFLFFIFHALWHLITCSLFFYRYLVMGYHMYPCFLFMSCGVSYGTFTVSYYLIRYRNWIYRIDPDRIKCDSSWEGILELLITSVALV